MIALLALPIVPRSFFCWQHRMTRSRAVSESAPTAIASRSRSYAETEATVYQSEVRGRGCAARGLIRKSEEEVETGYLMAVCATFLGTLGGIGHRIPPKDRSNSSGYILGPPSTDRRSESPSMLRVRS